MLPRTLNVFSDSVIFVRSAYVFCLIVFLTFIVSNTVSSSTPAQPIILTGFRVEESHAIYDEERNVYMIIGGQKDGQKSTLTLYGNNFSEARNVLFTKHTFSANETCDSMDHTSSFELHHVTPGVVTAEILIDSGTTDEVTYYMCVRDKNGIYHHLGDTSKLLVAYKSEHLMPLPAQICLVTLCLFLSSIFSGLNLGLMSLDVGELKLILKCGAPDDKKYAKAILPIRKRGNTLLCTLLFGNTIVNASCTLLLDDLIGQGVLALAGSTIGILIFGEIVPQSICSRYGLRVGYYCRAIVLFFMFALFPVTFSIGKLLDILLGREIHQVYSREELREMVKMSFNMDDSRSSSPTAFGGRGRLKPEEVKIVTGALEITEATVDSIMKKKEEIFMLDISVAIDYDLIELITRHGYTRIPIYANGDMNNIVGLLSTKDLLGIDPEDKLPLNSLVEYYPRSILRVLENTTILDMLNLFKTAKVHLAIVDKIVCDEEHDPIKEMVGIVTLEDVIEFILRDEINDEADDLKERRKNEEKADNKGPQQLPPYKRADTIPQQLNTAAVQFLIANVEAFRKEIVERKVLANLLRFPGIFIVKKHSGKNATHFSENNLYSAEKEADYFILILQGSCQVFIGRERLPFEAGPFHYFGLEALIGVGNIKTPVTHMSLSISPGSDNNLTSPIDENDDVYVQQQQQLLAAVAIHNVEHHDTSQTLTLGRRFQRSASRAKRLLNTMISHGGKETHEGGGGTTQASSSHHNLPLGKSSMASIATASTINEDDHQLSMKVLHKNSFSRQNSQTSLSSIHPAYQFSRKTFVPDFTVEITQDVQFVRLTNAHYRALLTVTQLVRRKEKLDDTAFIVDKLWMELVREGEQFPNFELVGPAARLMPGVMESGNSSLGSSSKPTPPSNNPLLPLRVSIPNFHHGESVGSQNFTPLSTSSKIQGVAETESTASLGTPSRHRHASPLHNAILVNPRSGNDGSHRKRSATSSSDAEPLLLGSSLLTVNNTENPSVDDSAIITMSPPESEARTNSTTNEK